MLQINNFGEMTINFFLDASRNFLEAPSPERAKYINGQSPSKRNK
jgi:hypothetical protein